jgi:hypothetical protein
VQPLQGRGAVVESGRKLVWAEHAGGIAELDADGNNARGGELVAPLTVRRVGRREDRHTSTVDVQDARHRAARLGGPMDIQRDLVAVHTGDRLGCSRDTFDRRKVGVEGTEQHLEAGFGLGAERQLFVVWRRCVDGRRLAVAVDPERDQSCGQARIGSRVVAQCHVRISQPSRQVDVACLGPHGALLVVDRARPPHPGFETTRATWQWVSVT